MDVRWEKKRTRKALSTGWLSSISLPNIKSQVLGTILSYNRTVQYSSMSYRVVTASSKYVALMYKEDTSIRMFMNWSLVTALPSRFVNSSSDNLKLWPHICERELCYPHKRSNVTKAWLLTDKVSISEKGVWEDMNFSYMASTTHVRQKYNKCLFKNISRSSIV